MLHHASTPAADDWAGLPVVLTYQGGCEVVSVGFGEGREPFEVRERNGDNLDLTRTDPAVGGEELHSTEAGAREQRRLAFHRSGEKALENLRRLAGRDALIDRVIEPTSVDEAELERICRFLGVISDDLGHFPGEQPSQRVYGAFPRRPRRLRLLGRHVPDITDTLQAATRRGEGQSSVARVHAGDTRLELLVEVLGGCLVVCHLAVDVGVGE